MLPVKFLTTFDVEEDTLHATLIVHGSYHQLRLSRFKLTGPPTPRDTEVSNAYATLHDSLGPVCIYSLIGINSIDITTIFLAEKVECRCFH